MNRQDIETIYNRHIPQKSWWGNVPESWELVNRDLPQVPDIYRLIPVCAKIALHMIGELPRITFVWDRNQPVNFNIVAIDMQTLNLDLPGEIRSAVFFGQFIHQLGHLSYSRDIYVRHPCTPLQKSIVHLIENRRVECRIVQAYPGYYHYLYAARNLITSLASLRAERELKFSDLESVRYNYLVTKLLHPELLQQEVFTLRLKPHVSRVAWIDNLLDKITDYAALDDKQVVDLARNIAARFSQTPKEELPSMFNYYSNIMSNLPLEVEGAPVDVDLKILDDLFQDLSKTFDLKPGPASLYNQKNGLKQEGEHVSHLFRELDAMPGTIDTLIMGHARELAVKIQLNFLAFQARVNRSCTYYEQESGELDEDELHQASFNPCVFMEEYTTPSAMLEVVIMLDLSGSMVDGGKLNMQTTLTTALALAFNGNPHVRFSIYGHRARQGQVEIVRYHEPGRPLDVKKLFSQEGMYVNADGYAIDYALRKFRTTNSRLLFMLSDGTPTAGDGTQPPRVHVREMVRKAKREGVAVLSIGISNFNQADMYDEFIPYSGPEVTTRLLQWLRRKFAAIADGVVY